MNIATFMIAHKDEALVKDTIESIVKYVGKDIIVVVDGAYWKSFGEKLEIPAHKIQGLVHGSKESPYKNMFLGMLNAYNLYPEADWYCYCEPDVLFGNSEFKNDLELLPNNCLMAGADLRGTDVNLPFLESICKTKIIPKYMLGCCMFFRNVFVKKLREGFISPFLSYTNPIDNFPSDYLKSDLYDIAEHLFPSLAASMGGKLHGFGHYDEGKKTWVGDTKYRLRFRPEIEEFGNFSIMHPSKKCKFANKRILSQKEIDCLN